MRHFATLFVSVATATTFAGCGSDDDPVAPTPTDARHGHRDVQRNADRQRRADSQFTVERAGTVTAQVKTLSDQAATLGVSLGTYNGAACQIIISNTAAVLNTTVAGTAQTTGQFCVWLNDVGKLTGGRRLLRGRDALLSLRSLSPRSTVPGPSNSSAAGPRTEGPLDRGPFRTSSPPQI